jgi:hypothetical protein
MIIKAKIFDVNHMKKVETKKEIDFNRALLLTKENVRRIKEELKIPGHQI